jgi:hypothetical protein
MSTRRRAAQQRQRAVGERPKTDTFGDDVRDRFLVVCHVCRVVPTRGGVCADCTPTSTPT